MIADWIELFFERLSWINEGDFLKVWALNCFETLGEGYSSENDLNFFLRKFNDFGLSLIGEF